jgi:hypothetical protein
MTNRLKTIAVLTAIVALSTTASAQTYSFTRTELGRVVPARFATTTQQLLASADVAVSMQAVVADAAPVKVDLVSEAMPVDNWNGTIALHESSTDEDADKADSREDDGFFSSTMGRASMAGIAGLAGASYFALRPAKSNAADNTLFSSLGNNTQASLPNPSDFKGTLPLATDPPPMTANPEPATMVLMATGLGLLGVVARRRRTS